MGNNAVNATDPTGHMILGCGGDHTDCGGSISPTIAPPPPPSVSPPHRKQSLLDLTPKQLHDFYQQNQGTGNNYCAAYAIATAINILTGSCISGNEIVNSYKDLPSGWIKYYWNPLDQSGAEPNQQVNIISSLFGRMFNVEQKTMSYDDLAEAISKPDEVVLFTFNTEPGNWIRGHVVVLAAYDSDPKKGFGFIDSGWGQTDELFWIPQSQMQNYINDPLPFNQPNFVIISRP